MVGATDPSPAGPTLAQIETSLDAAARGLLRRSYYTLTRTVGTVTATTLTNVLNKTTGGGCLYGIVMEDLDASVGTDQYAVATIDGGAAFTTNTRDLSAEEGLNLLRYLAMNDDNTFNDAVGATVNPMANSIFFDTSLQFQMASHATPTSGVRGTVIYGDPPESFGHKQGAIKELWEHAFPISVDKRIESAYLIAELKKNVDPEIDCIREEWQGSNHRIWVERAQTKTAISESMKLSIEAYCKTQYSYKRDTRPKSTVNGITNYAAPIIV